MATCRKCGGEKVNNRCRECHKAYMREYHRRPSARAQKRVQDMRYYSANRDARKAKMREYGRRPEVVEREHKRYLEKYIPHPITPLSEEERRTRELASRRKWKAANAASVSATNKAWRNANRDKVRIQKAFYMHRRRARRLGLPNTFTETQWARVVESFGHKCAYCDAEIERPTQDHLVPVVMGGGYEWGNIVPACSQCNRSKNAKNPVEWMGIEKYAEIVVRLH